MHIRAPGLSRLLLLCGALGVSFAALPEPTAAAQTASEIATARQWFADGLAREEKGDFAAALDLFRRAAQVKKTPQIVYHVGFCESRTGALVEALVDLESAATLARAAHMDNVVAASQTDLADVNARIPSVEVRVQGTEAPSRFVVDGSAIALSMLRSKMPLDPGEHTIVVELASGASATKRVTLAERDQRVVELAPSEGAVAVAPPPVVVPLVSPPPQATNHAESPSTSAHSAPVAGWVLTGVGGAAIISGVVLFLAARGKESDLHGACPTRTNCDPSLESEYNTSKTLNTAGLVVGAAGIVAAGIGISLVAVHSTGSTSTALNVTPRGLDLVTRF